MPSSSELRRPRGRATVFGAYVEGWRRVRAAATIPLGILILTWVVALPLAIGLRDRIVEQLGSSRVAEQVASGWDDAWASEFARGAQGVSRTLTHEILGFGGTLATLSHLLDGQAPPLPLVGALVSYLAVWLFLTGGILDRYARARPVPTSGFFATCGVFFFRFLRMSLVVGAAYWAIFRWLQPWLLGPVFDWGTRDLANEHQGLILRAWLYGILVATLAAVNLVADIAKVRAVVEDRHSAVSALLASVRFIGRRFWRCAGLYGLNLLGLVILARLWLQIAPSATDADWIALLAGQTYLIVRIGARLAFLASEVVFFQAELGHAHYAAPREPVWSDGPSVDELRRMGRAGPN